MSKIVIIKTGATGDVVRTTVLLHLYRNDDITWVTARHNIAVLPFKQPNLSRVIAFDDVAGSGLLEQHFDRVISLDDDEKCAKLASAFNAAAIFGAYWDGKVVYTEDSSEWFDMGLSSRFGKVRADEIKWENKDSYQEILFRMLGYTFKGEEYLIPENILPAGDGKTIGIEARAGLRWPTKVWNRYEDLAVMLNKAGYKTVFFEERELLKDYMQDIANTSLLISGDTLAMHIGLALKIPVVAIFTCTSAVEIYGYNRMEKLVSPHLKEAFYKTTYIPEAVESISLDSVYHAVQKCLKQR
jgi:heptosyltransferase II